MREAVSSGTIPFRDSRDKIEYLVLKSRTKDWEFPKGSIEDDEELQQTSLRELEEETSLTSVKLLDGFREDYSYIFESNGERVYKNVHLFIGYVYESSVDTSDEHYDYQWRTYEQARNTLTHSATKDILDKAHDFIQNSKY